jgi:branched-chain amino acid transport system substrate-binding protein
MPGKCAPRCTPCALLAKKQAAEKANSPESADVVKALNDTKFETVIGKFKFNEKGDPNLPPYAVYRWSNGTYEQNPLPPQSAG